MDSIFKTHDPRTDFIIESYSKVEDFMECYEHACSHYPKRLREQIKGWLEDWGYNEPEIEGNQVWFANPGYYDKERWIGIFYSIDGLTFDGLEADEPAKNPHIYLRIDENQSKHLKDWIRSSKELVRSNTPLLKKQEIKVQALGEDKTVIAKMFLDDVLHLRVLTKMSVDGIEKSLRGKVKRFTDALTGEKGLIKPFF